MIDKYSIAKALLNKTKEVADDNSYLLVVDGENYTPDVNTTYVQEFALFGDDVSVGLSDNSSDFQVGVYQININTPKAQAGAKWLGLNMASVFQSQFKKGLELDFNGQMIRIKNTSIAPLIKSETHLSNIISVTYTVIN